MKKTPSGDLYGSEYNDLIAYSPDKVNVRGKNTGGTDRPDMVTANTDSGSGRDLPPVSELFNLRNAGDYKLSLQFQVFKVVNNGTNHIFKLVKLPEVKVSVVNPSK